MRKKTYVKNVTNSRWKISQYTKRIRRNDVIFPQTYPLVGTDESTRNGLDISTYHVQWASIMSG